MVFQNGLFPNEVGATNADTAGGHSWSGGRAIHYFPGNCEFYRWHCVEHHSRDRMQLGHRGWRPSQAVWGMPSSVSCSL